MVRGRLLSKAAEATYEHGGAKETLISFPQPVKLECLRMKIKQRTLAMMTGFEQYSKKTPRAVFLEEME